MPEASTRYVLTLDADEPPGVVEFWSETRLPFEPKGGVKDMREALRGAVRRLQAGADDVLEATYASSVAGFCDVENILFYNVGVGCFSSAARNGVRFQRAAVMPDPPASLGWRPNHYHRYEVRPRAADQLSGRRLNLLASWRGVALPRLSESTSASAVWWATPPTTIGDFVATSAFGIQLDIRVPVGTAVNACAIIKPLLDGVVSACHSHDGSEIDAIASRLGARLGQPPDQIAARLMYAASAVLGTRRLLHLRADGVQWNPADDLCIAASISITTGRTPTREWCISGEIFEMEPR